MVAQQGPKMRVKKIWKKSRPSFDEHFFLLEYK